MRKILIVVWLIICTLSLTMFSSCKILKWLNDDWLTKNQRDIADEAMGRLCEAIKKKDTHAVKSEFSLYDISKVEDFDESVQKLFDYIKGDDLTYSFVSSGSDSAAMGGYPREREFGGIRYNLKTSTDKYKVVFGYRSHYSVAYDKKIKEKIGFLYFDIINEKNDRECNDRLYSGCPFGYNGINFDYKTIYIFAPEEYDYKIAYSDKMTDFDPIIINNPNGFKHFYSMLSEDFDLDSRPDKKGFSDVIDCYDESFFEKHSLYIVGKYYENGGYKYVPQFVYIDNIVFVDIAMFPYENNHGDDDESYSKSGVIIFIELPEKVSDEIESIARIYNPYERN